MDTDWQIGVATLSSGESYGSPDPDADTSESLDEGIAGVVIGGNAPTGLHDYYYLTSPSFDTSAATGPLWVEFQRWLNSDYTPYMQNIVEVFDGQDWNAVWESGSTGIQDDAWQTVRLDMAAHKSADTKLRFGFRIGSSGVFTVSQWNIDDVIVANTLCDSP